MTILATDTDTGNNAKVTYNIVSGGTSFFRLDADTGQLVARSQLLAAPPFPTYAELFANLVVPS